MLNPQSRYNIKQKHLFFPTWINMKYIYFSLNLCDVRILSIEI